MWSLLLSNALAKSWCAAPVVAHEWGVTVLTADDTAPERPALPAWFHTPGDPFAVTAPPVRTLPADSGIRTLPVVHFYGPDRPGEIPLGVEVGFRDGAASVWYPAVDALTPAAHANGPEAARARAELLRARESLEANGAREDLGPDPTRQLHWSALALSREARTRPAPAELPWVEQARTLPGALWVGQGPESERFLFYEADTVEAPAVRVAHEGGGVALTNTSAHPVYDVVLVHQGEHVRVAGIGPGATVRAALAPYDAAEVRAWLDARWSTEAEHDGRFSWTSEDCVMMRDPMRPLENAGDHRLYPNELELLWSVWAPRLLDPDASHLVYREAPAALDQAMPLSLYTDMRHYLQLSRLGVVLVEELQP